MNKTNSVFFGDGVEYEEIAKFLDGVVEYIWKNYRYLSGCNELNVEKKTWSIIVPSEKKQRMELKSLWISTFMSA